MIKMSEFARRRQTMMRKIGPNGIAILFSAKEVVRNGDAVYPFRQNSDFYYLTGFEEPDAVMVLAPKRTEGEYILFNRVLDRDREIWDGPRVGQKGAIKTYLAEQAFPIDEFELMLPLLLESRETIYFPLGSQHEFDHLLLETVSRMRAKMRSGLQAPISFVDVSPALHEMRLFKTPAEIALMQQAIDITELAHVRAMRACKPGLYEYQLEAELMHEFVRHGARFPAYGIIIGSGANTCILHYVKNDKKINNGELVLIDAGAEYQNYAADITRTFPANGRFSAEQRVIYELVLAAQLAAIKSLKPGVLWTKAQDIIAKMITQGLLDLGILKGSFADLMEKHAYLTFYMHRSGHWLGLDVHDVGRYRLDGKWRPLMPGMVLTVEPGIYISADIPWVAKRWHNIGVRIEDNVLITQNGCEVLSQAIPKKISEIEVIMAE